MLWCSNLESIELDGTYTENKTHTVKGNIFAR